MTPELWRWSARRQWHPVIRAHPLARLTFQTAITAPGPPIQTKTPTHRHNGHHCLRTRASLFGPSSCLCPLSAPGPIFLLILTRALEEFSGIACSHINETSMTAGQVSATSAVRHLIEGVVWNVLEFAELHCAHLVELHYYYLFWLLPQTYFSVKYFARGCICLKFKSKLSILAPLSACLPAHLHSESLRRLQLFPDIFHSFSQLR